MARRRAGRDRRERDDQINHERWLVSYADLMTLLLAFFVVMYAVSSVNEGKYRELTHALGSAFNSGAATLPLQSVAAPPWTAATPPMPLLKSHPGLRARQRQRRVMAAMAEHLTAVLAPLVQDGTVRVTHTAAGVKVEINASVLFQPGAAALSPHSRQVLTALSNALRQDAHPIEVEGHTDDLPIANAAFASNWELSAVRASSVVRLMIDGGVAAQRLTVIGRGTNDPVVSGDLTADRSLNRRVTVTILPGVRSQTDVRQ
jgi:chemotaxis protein MotB